MKPIAYPAFSICLALILARFLGIHMSFTPLCAGDGPQLHKDLQGFEAVLLWHHSSPNGVFGHLGTLKAPDSESYVVTFIY
ncbi:unnamed protein product [Coccothraustes coccothraustes]